MQIVKLTTKNFKALRLLEIDDAGSVVTLSGDNGSGKSSVLQAIGAALGGKAYQPERPVHGDADRGEVSILLDDGTRIGLTVRPDGARSLTVIGADGVKIAEPQKWLDRQLGAMAFDPLAFAQQKPKDQAEQLRKVIGLDLTEIDRKIAALEVERLGLGRDKDRADGAAKILPRYADAPAAPLDLVPLHMAAQSREAAVSRRADLAERAAAADAEADACDADVADLDRRMSRRATVEAERVIKAHADLDSEANELQRQREELARQLAAVDAKIASIAERKAAAAGRVKAELDAAAEELQSRRTKTAVRAAGLRAQAAGYRSDAASVEVPDTDELQAKIAAATEANRKVAANATATAADRAATAAMDAWQMCQREIEDLRRQRLATIRACAMPIEGLGFDNDGLVTFNGRPLTDASHAQQVITGMAIALAGNPQLRIVLMDEANSLDRKSLALVCAKAVEMHAQVWMARIEGGDGAIMIEDGERARPTAG